MPSFYQVCTIIATDCKNQVGCKLQDHNINRIHKYVRKVGSIANSRLFEMTKSPDMNHRQGIGA
jgi:hypothetical protein